MNSGKSILHLWLLVMLATVAAAQPWKPLGPDGGDVRSLAYDANNPDHIFLGTSSGTLFVSTDGGANWSRLAHLGSSFDLVLDHIVLDPSDTQTMYVSAWSAESSTTGDLFRSKDGGKTWEALQDMHGRSVRAVTIAPSNPKVLVAATLEGVFRSNDGGDNWQRISPEGHAEIKNLASVAIDPVNPEIIYAGTWHLPWKTEDGGKTWHSIKKGVIEDSDVFSIIVDPANPSLVFASACSGIYKSESAGELFHKIQGIPFSARRTRVLRMDPGHHNVIYAGTTEGLWKTVDAGSTWKRMTGANIVVNDVLVDPRNSLRVLLATDRGGVLASADAGATFAASNHGFTHRQVASLLVDRNDSSVIYAGLLNDREFGGVFVSHDSGQSWKQMHDGLDLRDVLVLRQTEDGSVVAGTNRGIFVLKPAAEHWQPLNNLEVQKKSARTRAQQNSMLHSAAIELTARIDGLEIGPKKWYALASKGLLVSEDQGGTWRRSLLPGTKACTEACRSDLVGISVAGPAVIVATRQDVMVSLDSGNTWYTCAHIDSASLINGVLLDHDGNIWVAAREGAFRSTDAGDSWQFMGALKLSNIASIQYDSETHRFLANASASTGIFESTDNGRSWHRTDSGWQIRDFRLVHGRLIAATAFDGVVIQPDSAPATRELSQTSESGNK
ncbi:MAG TPA: transcriptional regulator [Candidatus Angelobacter sp.]|jgi:photosystem II stability/assembly factor-like uncharacterized protein|nr:transcriptional regulator [Candidatus Angelobacter sp.]